MSTDRLYEFISTECVYFSEQPTKLTSGLEAKRYFDIKKALGVPDMLREIQQRLARLIRPEVDALLGERYGGVPLATAVSLESNLPVGYVRPATKQHGLGKRIEGYELAAGDRIALLDDVISTGGSIEELMVLVDQTGAQVVDCLTVVDRFDTATIRGVPIQALYLGSDFVDGSDR